MGKWSRYLYEIYFWVIFSLFFKMVYVINFIKKKKGWLYIVRDKNIVIIVDFIKGWNFWFDFIFDFFLVLRRMRYCFFICSYLLEEVNFSV